MSLDPADPMSTDPTNAEEATPMTDSNGLVTGMDERIVLRVPLNRAPNPHGDRLNVGIDHIDVPVEHDPDLPTFGSTEWDGYGGNTVKRIVLREWNEQVLLHELLHVALCRAGITSDTDPHGHEVISRVEVALWETGWRWRR